MQQVQQMQQAQTAAATEQQVQHMQQAQTAAATEPEDARPPQATQGRRCPAAAEGDAATPHDAAEAQAQFCQASA